MGGANIGISSILVIFVLLCLTTFATLAMVSAGASYRLAQRVAQASSDYYEADSRAEEVFAVVSRFVRTGSTDASELREYVETALGSDYDIDYSSGIISYVVPIDNTRSLVVSLERSGGVDLRVIAWRVDVQFDPGDFYSGLDVWVP